MSEQTLRQNDVCIRKLANTQIWLQITVKVFVHVPNYFSIEIEQLFLLFAEKFIELLFWIEKLNLFLRKKNLPFCRFCRFAVFAVLPFLPFCRFTGKTVLPFLPFCRLPVFKNKTAANPGPYPTQIIRNANSLIEQQFFGEPLICIKNWTNWLISCG